MDLYYSKYLKYKNLYLYKKNNYTKLLLGGNAPIITKNNINLIN